MNDHRTGRSPGSASPRPAHEPEPQVPGGSAARDRDWARNRISNFFKGQQGTPLLQRKPLGESGAAASGQGKAAPSGGAQSHAAAPHGAVAPPRRPGSGPQKTADIDELYREAAAAQTELFALTQAIAQVCHGSTKDPGLKGRPRALEKVAADYGGDASKLCDIARGSVVMKHPQDIQHAVKLVQAKAKVQRMKDRFASPQDGYRDMMFNLVMSNGHVCELQLQLEAIQQVKSGDGHKLYDQIRRIQDKAKIEKRDLTADEKEKVAELTMQMKGKYDDAYAGASKAQPT